MSFTVGLIADDLTGAGDAAVQFARRGWNTFLVLKSAGKLQPVGRRGFGEGEPGGGPTLLAVATGARALDNVAAERATARAVDQLVDAGIDRMFLKIDSTMRGSVPGQIAGALSAWRGTHSGACAVVCPAYPEMGRTVEANRILVDGQPVERSPFGRDPVTPVHTSDLSVLIPGSEKRGRGSRSLFSITTVDAVSDQDLAVLAAAIATGGASVIPVGSAGLARAMAALWAAAPERPAEVRPRLPRHPRILIQVTSLHPASLAQASRLLETFPEVRVLTGEAEAASAAMVELLKTERWDILGLIGGDGARAAVDMLGASAIRIVDSLIEGVPLGILIGGWADGMPVFTKAGGFGAEDALLKVVERIRA